MKKQNLTEQIFWKCESCGKEHGIRTCFCDECGASRPSSENYKRCDEYGIEMPVDYFFKDNFQEIRNPINIKFIDWIIVITAICMPLLCFVCSDSNIAIFLMVFLILSCILVIIATKRLLKNKIVKLWQRIIVFMISIYSNPITWMIYLMIFVIILKPLGPDYKAKRINKRKFSLARSEMTLHKNKYKEEYTNNGYIYIPGR